MKGNYTYADHVEAHEKSITLGGARVLHPVPPALTQGFARQIRMLVEEAEAAAFRRGYEEAQRGMRVMLGLGK